MAHIYFFLQIFFSLSLSSAWEKKEKDRKRNQKTKDILILETSFTSKMREYR
jgi:hypothetical protein